MEQIPINFWTYFAVFFVGLGLNLTPCVYPMLSVTISIFSHDESTRYGQSFLKAAVYVLGMVTMYSGLGVVVALTGGVFGAWLQHQWVLLGIAVLITALALSMFGLYRFQIPYWITSKIGGQQKAGLLGLYLSGLLVGIFAAPCIGPPVAALLAMVGAKQDPVFGFWIFFILSLGLGLPYLALGTFSHLRRRLPKTGVWMIWIEKLFGVILLSFAAYYFLIALNPEALIWLIPVALILGGGYLGFVEKSGDEKKVFFKFKKVFGWSAVIVAAVLIFNQPAETLTWEAYTPQKFATARQSRKPMMLDFYADWCIPCHEMELTTFRNPHVIEALQGFERLKVDLTNTSGETAQAAVDEFEILGVPTYIFYNAKGNEVPKTRRVGYVAAPELLRIIKAMRDE